MNHTKPKLYVSDSNTHLILKVFTAKILLQALPLDKVQESILETLTDTLSAFFTQICKEFAHSANHANRTCLNISDILLCNLHQQNLPTTLRDILLSKSDVTSGISSIIPPGRSLLRSADADDDLGDSEDSDDDDDELEVLNMQKLSKKGSIINSSSGSLVSSLAGSRAVSPMQSISGQPIGRLPNQTKLNTLNTSKILPSHMTTRRLRAQRAPRPSYLSDTYPPLPRPHTFQWTPTRGVIEKDPVLLAKSRADQQRLIEGALYRLRMAEAKISDPQGTIAPAFGIVNYEAVYFGLPDFS